VHRNLRAQNVLLVLASYVFYGWWDWRFLGLIAFSTVVDYFVGLRIEAAAEKRKCTSGLNSSHTAWVIFKHRV
jgi:alginate O-acetyltransferase complex protein AlgI